MLTHPDSVVGANRAARPPSASQLTPRARRMLSILVAIVGSSLLIGVVWIVSLLVPK
jgi:hypothetical protein